MNFKHLISYFMLKIKRDNIGAYAAQAALFIIMSVIPFLLVILSLLRFTSVTESMILYGIDLVLPGYVSSWLVTIVREVYNNAAGVLPVAVIFAVFTAAKAMQSMRYGLNLIYEIDENRNWFFLRLRAMAETFLLILLILLSMILLVFGQKIQHMLEDNAPFVAVVTESVLKYRLLIMFFVLIIFFLIIYKILPNRNTTFRSRLVGSVVCSIAWYIFSYALSFYVNYFNGFSFYGSLTTIVLLMFWLYFAMYIFLICGIVNSVFEIILLEARVNRERKRGAGQTIPH